MATVIIPIQNADTLGNFYFNISLDGVTYQLYFRYNRREDFFYIDINDIEGNPIRSGLKIVVNFPLLRRCVLSDSPPGELLAIDTRPEPNEPNLDDFGKDQILTYVEESSLP